MPPATFSGLPSIAETGPGSRRSIRPGRGVRRRALLCGCLLLLLARGSSAGEPEPGTWAEWHATLAPKVTDLPWLRDGAAAPPPEAPDAGSGRAGLLTPVRVALRASVLPAQGGGRRVRLQAALADASVVESRILPAESFAPVRPAEGTRPERTESIRVSGRTYAVGVYPLGRAPEGGEGGQDASTGADTGRASPEQWELRWSPDLPFGLAEIRAPELSLRLVAGGRGGDAPPFPLPFAEGTDGLDAAGEEAAAGRE